nr:hypothetical protein [Tessaracoccus coleopterorum]
MPAALAADLTRGADAARAAYQRLAVALADLHDRAPRPTPSAASGTSGSPAASSARRSTWMRPTSGGVPSWPPSSPSRTTSPTSCTATPPAPRRRWSDSTPTSAGSCTARTRCNAGCRRPRTPRSQPSTARTSTSRSR